MANRKLGKAADQRKALLRNQVTNLIWYGRIETIRNQNRFTCSAVFLCPCHQPLQIGACCLGMIPAGVNIPGHHIHQIHANIRKVSAGCIGYRTGGIQLPQMPQLCGVDFPTFFRFTGALVQYAPDIDAGVVHMLGNHLDIALGNLFEQSMEEILDSRNRGSLG